MITGYPSEAADNSQFSSLSGSGSNRCEEGATEGGTNVENTSLDQRGTSYSAEGGAVGGNQSSTLEQNTGHSAPATPFSDEDIAQNVSPCPKGTSTLGDSTVSSDANLHGPQQLPTIPPDGSLPDQFTVNPSANGIDGSGSLMVDGNQDFEERGTAVSDEHLVAGSEEQLSVSSNSSSHSDDSTSGK